MATKVAKYDIKQLVRFIESRHVAVPEFQRGFVWKTAQVKKLFDSIVNQYPVGSFILWETNKNIDARTLDGEKLPKRKFLILDGQQRMVSIFYLCRQKLFVEPHVKDKFHETCDSRERDVIDFEKFYIGKNDKRPVLEYVRDSSCKLDFKKFRRLIKGGYKLPVITVTLDDYRKAIDVFQRINQAGTAISTESIFLSETWNTHANIGKILRIWKRKNKDSLTSKIDTVIFIHVFALILQLEEKKENENIEIGIKTLKKIADQVRKAPGETYDRMFKNVVGSIARAVQHLTEKYEIVHLGELPSQTMITVLSVFFYYQKRSLSIIQLTELCIKQALWQQKPVFINGSPVSRNDVESGQHNPEDDHFFPYDLSRKGIIGQEINNILNIHFLNGDENSRKRNQWPSKWLHERIEQIKAKQNDIKKYLKSQLLPFESLKELIKYERASKLKGKVQQREFARMYKRFLGKRFKLFEEVLIRLQNGHTR